MIETLGHAVRAGHKQPGNPIERALGLGGSEAAIALGLNPWESPA